MWLKFDVNDIHNNRLLWNAKKKASQTTRALSVNEIMPLWDWMVNPMDALPANWTSWCMKNLWKNRKNSTSKLHTIWMSNFRLHTYTIRITLAAVRVSFDRNSLNIVFAELISSSSPVFTLRKSPWNIDTVCVSAWLCHSHYVDIS